MSEKRIKRFWSHVDRRGNNECWQWLTASKTSFGYGLVQGCERYKGYSFGAHCVAYALANGQEASGLVRHLCHNPGCCNPAHLVEGSRADNTADMMSAGRHRAGAMRHYDDTTVAEAIRLRQAGERPKAIAERLGCHYVTVIHWTKDAAGRGAETELGAVRGRRGRRVAAASMAGCAPAPKRPRESGGETRRGDPALIAGLSGCEPPSPLALSTDFPLGASAASHKSGGT